MQYYGQIGQDQYVNEHIFYGMENGFFVDIGAHDGISLSNTYFFETVKNWRGICVEPIPEVFESLRNNRKCICFEGAISESDGYKDFMRIEGPIEMLSGLIDGYDLRHKALIDRAIQDRGGHHQIIKVKTRSLQSILDEYNVTHIDLLSVDTEGAELTVLQTIDYRKVKIRCIVVENNYGEKKVEQFLEGYGFKLVKHLVHDDIFLRFE